MIAVRQLEQCPGAGWYRLSYSGSAIDRTTESDPHSRRVIDIGPGSRVRFVCSGQSRMPIGGMLGPTGAAECDQLQPELASKFARPLVRDMTQQL
jgi:hypothetical protein